MSRKSPWWETPLWARVATTPRLADVALKADDEIRGGAEGMALEILRGQRRIALNELVRRGSIDSYKLLPAVVEAPSQARHARDLWLRTHTA